MSRKKLFNTARVVFAPMLPLVVLGWLCNQSQYEPEQRSFTILQLNDVYEIAPLPGSNEGGLARVAAFREELERSDNRLITVLAGDFLSPSVLGSLKEKDSKGKEHAIAGKHMVEVMNAMGVDLVTFGNHEFDIAQPDLQSRIDESKFDWVASNVGDTLERPFRKNDIPIEPHIIKTFKYSDDTLNVGIIGLTLRSDYKYARTSDYIAAVKRSYDSLRSSNCRVIIALTHVNFADDSVLAQEVPGLHLIIGGHEHKNNRKKIGNTIIAKADANARTVYVHNIVFDPKTDSVKIHSRLKGIDGSLRPDPDVEKLVDKWMDRCFDLLREKKYEPRRVICRPTEPLDGLEESTRNGSTNYTRLITKAMQWATMNKHQVLFNSGSLRLDDQLSGAVNEYDIYRSLPYDGTLQVVDITGRQLAEGVEKGMRECKPGTDGCMRGSGGFLHGERIELRQGIVYVDNKKIEPNTTYHVLMTDYLADGCEKGLEMLNGTGRSPAKLRDGIPNEIKQVVIRYIEYETSQGVIIP